MSFGEEMTADECNKEISYNVLRYADERTRNVQQIPQTPIHTNVERSLSKNVEPEESKVPTLPQAVPEPVKPVKKKKGKILKAILIIVLIICAAFAIQWIDTQRNIESFEKGVLYGTLNTDAALRNIIMKLAGSCQVIPVDFPDNTTYHLQALECFDQGAKK